MRNPVLIAAAALIASGAARAASAGEPRGPEFGNVRYVASIEQHGSTADTDDYVALLAKGDRISVSVTASGKSKLVPTLALVGPDESVFDPGAATSAHGRQVSLKTFVVTATGKWAVRVGGASATQGVYAVRFHVTNAKGPRVAKQHLGGGAPLVASQEFDAVAGSKVTLSVRRAGKGAAVTIRSLTGPDAAEVANWSDAVVARGGTSTIKALPLGDSTGTYRVEFGIDAGEATCSATIAVTPPSRPKGSVSFGDEPVVGGLPVDGTGGQIAHFTGAHFSVFPPYPKVWIDDQSAAVVSVGAGGTSIDVVVPPAPGDTISAVTVQNPDGQSATRAGEFHYVPQGPLDVASIEPSSIRVAEGLQQQFKVTLTRVAAPPGIDVALASTADLGTLPTFVHVVGNTSSATFLLQAGPATAAGEIHATFASTVSADVGVVPPGTIAAITPADVTLLENVQQTFTVVLSSAADSSGADVALTIPAAVGTGPSTVRVAPGKASASFVLTAAGRRGSARIRATLGGDAETNVNVSAPTSLDLSGWSVVQQNSSLTYTIPAGTVLQVGDCIVIGKDATRSQFQSAWLSGFAFASQVHYLAGAGFPDIDGYESFQLKDADGNSMDGPTIQMQQNGAALYRRNPGQPAGQYASWLAYGMVGPPNVAPGVGELPSPGLPGIYVSAFGDPNFYGGRQDFVELYLDEMP